MRAADATSYGADGTCRGTMATGEVPGLWTRGRRCASIDRDPGRGHMCVTTYIRI
jgi:hypothetical protein